MTEKKIKWEPDVCDCVIFYIYDDDLPDEEKIFSEHSDTIRCALHDHVIEGEVYDAVSKECWTKSMVFNHILQSNEKLQENSIGPDGSRIKIFKEGMIPEYRFDENRNLIITSPHLDSNEKETARIGIVNIIREGVPVTIE